MNRFYPLIFSALLFTAFSARADGFGHVHDIIFRYSNGGKPVFNVELTSYPQEYIQFNDFASLNLTGKFHVRDLWRQANLPDVNTIGSVLPLTIPAHGVVLHQFTAAK